MYRMGSSLLVRTVAVAGLVVTGAATGCGHDLSAASPCARAAVAPHGSSCAGVDGEAWERCIAYVESKCAAAKDTPEVDAPEDDAAQPVASLAPTSAPTSSASSSNASPPSAEDVTTAAQRAVVAGACAGAGRRVLVEASLQIQPDGTTRDVSVERSSSPTKALLDCVTTALHSATVGPFVIPAPSGKSWACPPGTEGAAVFNCMKGPPAAPAFLAFSVALAISESGEVVPLAKASTETLHVEVYGDDTPILSGGEVVGITTAPTWWAADALGEPQYCERSPNPREGWCFTVKCKGETGHAGLTKPSRRGDVCDARPKGTPQTHALSPDRDP